MEERRRSDVQVDQKGKVVKSKKIRLPKLKVGVTTADRNRWKKEVGWA